LDGQSDESKLNVLHRDRLRLCQIKRGIDPALNNELCSVRISGDSNMSEPTADRDKPPDGVERGSPGVAATPVTRRRLILGTAAVLPSVYTLSSGAQMAVTSSQKCWNRVSHNGNGRIVAARDGSDGEEVEQVTTSNDKYLRKQVYTGTSGGQPAYCAMMNQASCIDPDNPGKAAAGSVWVVDGQRVVAGVGATIDNVSLMPQGYGLVYVDPNGTVATLDPGVSQQLRPVTEPCWNSIIGGRRSSLLG
jgi:hypothetical protein